MKENHGIRHIEWNISLQWMKRQKKYCLMVVWVAILACMLMQTGFLITDGISSAVMNQRKNIYGEWEYGLVNMDADSQTLIEDHPFIESKGKIQIYGVLAGSYMDNKQANIGTMDQTAWNIGYLQMLKGHLPENEQEIAMESGMLTALGYQGEPGEKITLNIVTTTAYQNDMVGKAGTVYIKELSAPAGYKVDKTVYSLKIEAGKTATLNVSDTPKVTDTLIELFKIDMETQKDNPQGNASLEGAEFTWKYYAGFYTKGMMLEYK